MVTNCQSGAKAILGLFLYNSTVIIVNNKKIQLNENDAHKMSYAFDLVTSSLPHNFLGLSNDSDNSSIALDSIVSTMEKPVMANPNTQEQKDKMSPHSSCFCISQ